MEKYVFIFAQKNTINVVVLSGIYLLNSLILFAGSLWVSGHVRQHSRHTEMFPQSGMGQPIFQVRYFASCPLSFLGKFWSTGFFLSVQFWVFYIEILKVLRSFSCKKHQFPILKLTKYEVSMSLGA